MPSAVTPNPRAGSTAPDDVDKLFNYDDVVEDFLKDMPLGNDSGQNNNTAPQEPTKDIDEEITVKKKRKPVPKLDEARLLSDAGIPRLRKITKSQLRFRGKGHEFSDISRLLNTYQLWLDDLFPRAKFKDALIDTEKVGHTKRMQVTRRAWLDATKPRQRDASPERENDDVVMSGALLDVGVGEGHANATDSGNEAIFGESLSTNEIPDNSAGRNEASDAPNDDELDAMLAESGTANLAANVEPVQRRKGPFEDDESDEDDLDALLAENGSTGLEKHAVIAAPRKGSFEEDEPDEDDLDALLAEESSDATVNARSGGLRTPVEAEKANASLDDEFADEEEVMAGMDTW